MSAEESVEESVESAADLRADLMDATQTVGRVEAQLKELALAVKSNAPDLQTHAQAVLDAESPSGLLLASLRSDAKGLRMQMTGWPVTMLARAFHTFLDEGAVANYAEVSFQTESGKPCVVIVARSHVQTPHALRQAAEARVRELEARVKGLEAQLETLRSTP